VQIGLTQFRLQGKNAAFEVPGQVVRAENEDPALREETIHTYALDQRQQMVQLQFSKLLENVAPAPARKSSPSKPIELKKVDDLQGRLGKLRSQSLSKTSDTKPRADRAVPKDASFHPSSYLMYTSGDATDTGYARQMAQVGRVEGFGLEVMGSNLRSVSKEIAQPNVAYIGTSVPGACWTEDYGERTFKGGVVVPSYLDKPSLVAEAIDADRPARLPANVSTNFSEHGAVSEGNYQRLLLSAGETLGWKCREAFSHIEGGNVLTGTLPDGNGYALVGKDSLAVTKAKLAKDLGRAVSTPEALALIGRDLGVDGKQVHAIEQPGEFHLDMRILGAAPGQVVVNDARQAHEVQSQWLLDDYAKAEPKLAPDAGWVSKVSWKLKHYAWQFKGNHVLDKRLDDMAAEAERRAVYENLAVKDLKAAGLRVDRMAAVFVDPKHPEEDITNFVNGRGGMNSAGERFFIGLGADARSEAYAADQLMRVLPTGFSRVHFLSRDLTPKTLALSGGIKCRTKPAGQPASLAELMKPYPSRVYLSRQSTVNS
jgi:hypothetical protein